eukprot:TRINITY_DN25515_c0_g1_i1.p1 TRINITY_DN25515_c0_g1~~TRINITY_DN25515_c0_g1_i1.p1  ORF type:complete len:201 (-),score=38.91 TRINITY_DN25515_c0_g1_i1:160-762(-)
MKMPFLRVVVRMVALFILSIGIIADAYVETSHLGRKEARFQMKDVRRHGAEKASIPEDGLKYGSSEEGSTTATGTLAVAASACAVLGLMSRRRALSKVSAGLMSGAVALVGPMAATADDFKQVDINNATVNDYKELPSFYPMAATVISSHGPYSEVKEIYDIPNLSPVVKALFKKYEAYFIIESVRPKELGRMTYSGAKS